MRFHLIVLAAALAACPTVVPPPQPTDEGEGEEGEGEEGEGDEGEGEEGEGDEGEGDEGEGDEGEGEEGEGDEGEGEGEGVDVNALAVEVVLASSRPGQIVDEALKTLLDVVVFASNAPNGGNGSLRTFGTVTQNAAGQASYAAAPADALVLVAPGVSIRFDVDTFAGDFAVNDVREFYLHAHDVVASVVVTGGDADDFDFESHLAGNSNGTKSGAGVSGGDTFSVDASVVVSSDVSGGAVEYRSTDTRSGSVGDLDFTDVSAYHLVLVDNVAEDLVNTLTVSGTLGGSTWSMTDGLVKRTFRNGAAVEADFWGGTSGALRKDGAAFGALFARDAGGAFEIVLVTGNPDDPDNIHVLETHPN